MEIVHALAEQYAQRFTSKEESLLHDIHQQTVENHPHAHMLSGHVQGQFLTFISQLLQPTHILEIGTFTGYSAICLAKGLAPNGVLHTIELREEDAKTAQENFSKCLTAEQLNLHVGNALEIIPQLNIEWDLVFIDADKTAYIDYYELIVPRLSKRVLYLQIMYFFMVRFLKKPSREKMQKPFMHLMNM